MAPVKIAVIGAQGVGKSTLCNALIGERTDVHFLPETVRNCPYPVNEASDFRTQWWIACHQILAEQEAHASKQPFIVMDRSLIDTAAYTNLIHKVNPRAISLSQRNLIFETISNWLSLAPYHKVFHLQVEPLIWQHRDVHDGFRSTNLEWFQSIEAEYRSVLQELEIRRNAHYIQFDNNGRLEVSIRRFLLEFELDAMKLHRAPDITSNLNPTLTSS